MRFPVIATAVALCAGCAAERPASIAAAPSGPIKACTAPKTPVCCTKPGVSGSGACVATRDACLATGGLVDPNGAQGCV